MTELYTDNTEGGALAHLIARSRQIQADHRAKAKEPETQQDRRNLLMTLRAFGMQTRDKVRGAL